MRHELKKIMLMLIWLLPSAEAVAQCFTVHNFTNRYECLTLNSSVGYTIYGCPPPFSYTFVNVITNATVASGSLPGNTGTITGIASGSYSVYLQAANNGTAVTFYAVNVAMTTSNSVIQTTNACNGANGTAYVTPPSAFTSGLSYSWSPGGYSGQSVNTLSPNVLYTVTVSDAQGCVISNTVMLNETIVDAAVSTTYIPCFQGTVTSVVTPTGGTAPYTYSLNNAPSSATISVTAGQYTVKARDANGCYKNLSFQVQQAPQQIITHTLTQPRCSYSTDGSITASVTGTGPYSYSWSPGISSIPSLAGLTAGSYSISVINGNGCLTRSVISLPAPAPLSTGFLTKPEDCSAQDGAFTVTASGGTGPYSFTTAPVNVTGSVVSGLSTGTYSVLVKDFNDCTDTAEVQVGNLSTVSLSILSIKRPECYNVCDGSFLLNVQNGISPVTYTVTGFTPTTSPSFTGLCAGFYQINALDNIGCPATATISFPEQSPLTYSVETPPVLCIGQSATLSASAEGGQPGYTYLWKPVNLTTVTITVSPHTSTNYSLQVFDSQGCTHNPLEVPVKVNGPLSIDVTDSGLGICPGTTAQVTPSVSGGDGNYTYLWQPGNHKSPTLFINNINLGQYELTIADGCGTPTVSRIVNINLFPVVKPLFKTVGDSGCVPYCTSFINLTPGSANPVWNFGDGPAEEKGDTIYHCYTKPGVYNLKLMLVDSNGCAAAYTYTDVTNVLPKPAVAFRTNPALITLNNADHVKFENHTQRAFEYKWLVNGKLWTYRESPEYTFSDTGCTDFRLVAYNRNTCSDSLEKTICVSEGFNFYMPAAFTPNGDGLNDILVPKGTGWLYDNYLMEVYNRWGGLIFSSSEVRTGWDGNVGVYESTDTARNDPNDIYVWRVRVTDNQQKQHEMRGSVMLLR